VTPLLLSTAVLIFTEKRRMSCVRNLKNLWRYFLMCVRKKASSHTRIIPANSICESPQIYMLKLQPGLPRKGKASISGLRRH